MPDPERRADSRPEYPNDTIRTLREHRSIRTFADEPMPDADVLEAVRAGQAAATSSAVQAYSLIRVRDASKRERLAELTGPQEKVARAPAFFVVCGDARRHRLLCARAGAAYDQRLEAFLVAAIDATLFAQNLVVAFESMGYGTCYIGGLRTRIGEVDELLGIPEHVYPLYGLCVGKPAESPSIRPRLPVGAVLFEEAYPSDADLLAEVDAYDAAYKAYLASRAGGPGPRAPSPWGERMSEKYRTPERTHLAGYYRGKGARLD